MKTPPTHSQRAIFSLDFSPIDTPHYGLRIHITPLLFRSAHHQGACQLRFYATRNLQSPFVALLTSSSEAPGWSLTNGIEAAARESWNLLERWAVREPCLKWPLLSGEILWIEHLDDRQSEAAQRAMLENLGARTEGESFRRVTFKVSPFRFPQWQPILKTGVAELLEIEFGRELD